MFYPYGGFASDGVARVSASQAESHARRAETEVELLKAYVERTMMICEALWTMLKEQHGYSDDDLVHRIEEIDLRDGRLDGRVAPAPAELCPTCGRTLHKSRPVCLYCGQAVRQDPFQR